MQSHLHLPPFHPPPPLTPITPPPNQQLITPTKPSSIQPQPTSLSLASHLANPQLHHLHQHHLHPQHLYQPIDQSSYVTPKRRRTSSTTPRAKRTRSSASKSSQGLKNFTTTVATKLEHYGSSSYTAVADELVEEAQRRLSNEGTPFNPAEIDKNVRRRVYDALNVFSSMGFVKRDGKTVTWKGTDGFLKLVGMHPCSCATSRHVCPPSRVRHFKTLISGTRQEISHKQARLEELRRQELSVRQIMSRNASKEGSRLTTGVVRGDAMEYQSPDVDRVELPFLMLCGTGDVNVEISDAKDDIILTVKNTFQLLEGYSIVRSVMEDSGTGWHAAPNG